MQIQLKKETVEQVEVEIPAFYKVSGLFYYALSETSVITITDDSIHVVKSALNKSYYQRKVAEAIEGIKITWEEFESSYQAAQTNIKEVFNKQGEEALTGTGALAD